MILGYVVMVVLSGLGVSDSACTGTSAQCMNWQLGLLNIKSAENKGLLVSTVSIALSLYDCLATACENSGKAPNADNYLFTVERC